MCSAVPAPLPWLSLPAAEGAPVAAFWDLGFAAESPELAVPAVPAPQCWVLTVCPCQGCHPCRAVPFLLPSSGLGTLCALPGHTVRAQGAFLGFLTFLFLFKPGAGRCFTWSVPAVMFSAFQTRCAPFLPTDNNLRYLFECFFR